MQEAAFQASKDALANAVLLQHPSPFAQTALTVDASDHAVGAALSQRGGDQVWRPLAFFSKTMTPAERKYSAFDRELLAIYLSIKHFRHFLEGRSFTIFTDHKPLTFALASSTDRLPWQTRHLSYIAEFSSDIRHIKGSENVVADALSRLTINACDLPSVDFAAMAAAQDRHSFPDSSLKVWQILWNGISLCCDTSTGIPRPLVPASFQRPIFQALHSLSHPGPKPSTRLISARFVWSGMKKDIRDWCKTCHDCQSSKVA